MLKKLVMAGMVLGLSLSLVAPLAAGPKKMGYPNIHKAINALEMAKKDMEKAGHDFGGHKADAIAACDKAIEQLKLALQFKAEEGAMKKNESQK
jgi:hypothetical protein